MNRLDEVDVLEEDVEMSELGKASSVADGPRGRCNGKLHDAASNVEGKGWSWVDFATGVLASKPLGVVDSDGIEVGTEELGRSVPESKPLKDEDVESCVALDVLGTDARLEDGAASAGVAEERVRHLEA